MFLGTGNGDIEQSALLFQLAHRTRTHRRRKDVLLQSNDKHGGKLQTLCCMNRHQRHLRLVFAPLAIEIGKQRHLLQEVTQSGLPFPVFLLATLNEILHTAQELL